MWRAHQSPRPCHSPHPFDLFPLNLHPPPPPKGASAAPNPGRLGPGGQPPALRAGLCLSRWGPSPPRASWNPRTEAPTVSACGSFPPTGDSLVLSWSCQSREDEGGAGGERQGPEAQAQAKARTSGTWALETMRGAGATGRGAAAPAPTLPAPCGCRAPLQKRGPLSENGVLRPGQSHWITARVPGSLGRESPPHCSLHPSCLDLVLILLPCSPCCGRTPGSVQQRPRLVLRPHSPQTPTSKAPAAVPGRPGRAGRRQLLPRLPQQRAWGLCGTDCGRSQKLEAGDSGERTVLLSQCPKIGWNLIPQPHSVSPL